MILVDPPIWPAHGRTWSHLASDVSFDELHRFAASLSLPERSFHRDHYDLPASRYDDAVSAGAEPASSRDIVRRLVAAGLRRRPPRWDGHSLRPDERTTPMNDARRSVRVERTEAGRYRATNVRGGELTMATGGEGDTDFTPVELLLAALAGCSAVDVDTVTSRRAEPLEFVVDSAGDKIRDEQGNRLTDLQLTFRIRFPDDDGGRQARDIAPRAVQQSHDRLCTVSRTVEIGTPVDVVTDIDVS